MSYDVFIVDIALLIVTYSNLFDCATFSQEIRLWCLGMVCVMSSDELRWVYMSSDVFIDDTAMLIVTYSNPL